MSFAPEVKVPLTILVPEIDEFCTPEIVEQFRAILSAKPEVHYLAQLLVCILYVFLLFPFLFRNSMVKQMKTD
jgi:hypothetical protein